MSVLYHNNVKNRDSPKYRKSKYEYQNGILVFIRALKVSFEIGNLIFGNVLNAKESFLPKKDEKQ